MTKVAITGDELPDRYVRRDEAAAFLAVSPKTLASWASAGCGPRFTKLSGGRSAAVRYSLNELRRFAADPQAYAPRPVAPFVKPRAGLAPVAGGRPVRVPGPNAARSRRRRNGKARTS